MSAADDVHSSKGALLVDFSFRSSIDVYGLTLYCYVTSDNLQAPTLRVHPGDEVVLNLKNDLPAPDYVSPHSHASGQGCGSGTMTASSTNLHFHGLTIPPFCHQDDTLRTRVQPSSPAFEYRFTIPQNESPGLYWYHPHPHGFSEAQVLGGASGALIVEGIERVKPHVSGLPERVLILRDQSIAGMRETEEDALRPRESASCTSPKRSWIRRIQS